MKEVDYQRRRKRIPLHNLVLTSHQNKKLNNKLITEIVCGNKNKSDFSSKLASFYFDLPQRKKNLKQKRYLLNEERLKLENKTLSIQNSKRKIYLILP